MYTESIANQFARMGARFRVTHQQPSRWGIPSDYALDIQSDSHGQIFELRLPPTLEPSLDLAVLQVEEKDRHLVLLVKQQQTKDRFLCGHDEREWFVAAVPDKVTTVKQAKESLKPASVRQKETRQHLKSRLRLRRHNAVSIRQGEWFFVPASDIKVDQKMVLKNEPIRRGAGKPHYIAEMYRFGGETVYVCDKFPNGLKEAAYKAVILDNPKALNWKWRVMRRNPAVYARGTVRHPDHATIKLVGWHEVLMNTETQSRTMSKVAFLD